MGPLQAAESVPASVVGALPSPNRLLAALPPGEYQRLKAELVDRPFKARQVLHKHADRISEIYFPARSVCCVTNPMEDGGVVQVATIGKEGLVGAGAALGGSMATGDAFVQLHGDGAVAMGIEAFRCEMDRRGPFHDIVTRYSQAFLGMIMQTAACNGLHSAEQRCCRWLLMTHDRVERDEFALTHEFLAVMLGVRRPTVTLVLADLQRAGIISHLRGQVRLVNRQALEAASCECYRTVNTQYERLLSRSF